MKSRTLFTLGLVSLILTISSAPADEPAVSAVGATIPLTPENEFYMNPVWSPTGDQIAVTNANYYGIQLVNYPQGDVIPLADEPAVGFEMQWSHDGSRIAGRAAHFQDKRRYNALVTYDVVSGVRNQLTDYATTMPGTPVWTTDDQFLYLNGNDHFQLYAADANRSASVQATGTAVYVMRDGIQQRDLTSSVSTPITTVPGRVLNLTRSSTGKLAFEIIGGHLWICDADGSNPIDLGIGNHPAWNPAGSKLAFMIGADDGHTYLSADIYVVNTDGTGRVNLTNSTELLEMHPTWSPDGQHIAYDTLNRGQIFVQEVR